MNERLQIGAFYMTPGGSVFRLCARPRPYYGFDRAPHIWAYPSDSKPTVTDEYVNRPLTKVEFAGMVTA